MRTTKRMMRTTFVNFIEEENPDLFSEEERLMNSNKRGGPCEDDYEHTAPYIDRLPDESEHEDGSPLKFS